MLVPPLKKIFALERLKKMFKKVKSSSDRNAKIYPPYNEDFYQHAIAETVGLSQPYLNSTVKPIREKAPYDPIWLLG